MSDKCLPSWTLLQPSFRLIFISHTSFVGISNSVRIFLLYHCSEHWKNYKQMTSNISPRNSNQKSVSIMMMMKYLSRILFTAWVLRIISVPPCIDFFQSSNSLKQKTKSYNTHEFTIQRKHYHTFWINYETRTIGKMFCKQRMTYRNVR
jgi:hypothetical protein